MGGVIFTLIFLLLSLLLGLIIKIFDQFFRVKTISREILDLDIDLLLRIVTSGLAVEYIGT